MFQLTLDERAAMRAKMVSTPAAADNNSSQIVVSLRKSRGITYRLYAFTKQGVAMLSSLLQPHSLFATFGRYR